MVSWTMLLESSFDHIVVTSATSEKIRVVSTCAGIIGVSGNCKVVKSRNMCDRRKCLGPKKLGVAITLTNFVMSALQSSFDSFLILYEVALQLSV